MNNVGDLHKNNDKAAVFEELSYFYLPLLLLYLLLDYRIWYLEISPGLLKWSKISKLIQKNKLQKVEWNDFNIDRKYKSHDLAYKNFEDVWEGTFKRSRLLKHMARLVGSENIQLAYKKYMIERLQIYYNICLLLNFRFKDEKLSGIIFLPVKYLEIGRWWGSKGRVFDQSPALDSKITLPFLARLYGSILLTVDKWVQMGITLLLPFWTLAHIRKIRIKKTPPKKYQTGFRVYYSDVGFRYRYQKIDFLVDDKSIKSDEVFFCNERDISPEYKKEFEDREYDLIPLQDVMRDIDVGLLGAVLLKKYIFISFSCFFSSFFEKKDMIFVTNALVSYFPLWAAFLEKYKFNNYVVYNNISFTHVMRNVMFSGAGIKTWYYTHSNHTMDLFSSPNRKQILFHVTFCYMYYDNFVSWGEKVTSFYKNKLNKIDNFLELGCPWSEFVRIAYENGESTRLRKSAIKELKNSPKKIIGVFDTTFGGDVPLRKEDMEKFIDGLIKLLDDFPNICIILKEKKPWEEVVLTSTSDIASVYEKLRKHERCFAPGYSYYLDPQEVIAASDLVISACFTSPTTIALAARKKGIFYDATSRFKGYSYDNFPKFVAHGYTELKSFVKYWLEEITEDEFDEYLKKYIKGEVDAYVDGKSISRFREELIKDPISGK